LANKDSGGRQRRLEGPKGRRELTWQPVEEFTWLLVAYFTRQPLRGAFLLIAMVLHQQDEKEIHESTEHSAAGRPTGSLILPLDCQNDTTMRRQNYFIPASSPLM
jgi:hypothetical protein